MFPLLLLAFFSGAAVVIVVQYVLYKQWIGDAESRPAEEPERVPHTGPSLPQELAEMIANDDGLRTPASCAFLNLMGSFIFADLKDSLNVKRFLMRKMTAELEELLLSKLAGRVILDLTVRDYSLGNALPVFDNISVERCRASDAGDVLEELDIAGDISYSGGFHIAIDAMLVLGKSASVSVRVNKLEGRVVLKFSRLPFTHWCFAFCKEPDMELDIKSTLAGKSLDQLTKLIRSQIRRSVRKKHTLPNFKVRYKPFFIRQEAQDEDKKAYLNIDGEVLSQGLLKVEVVEATRLPKVQHATHLYCTLGVARDAWAPSGGSPRSRWEVQIIEVRRERPGASIGAVFREVYEELEDERSALTVVASVKKDSSSYICGLLKDDIILSINGTAVSSLDHAVNIIRSSTQRSLQFEIQRPPAGVYINVVYAESSSASASAAAATTPTGGGGAAAASTANAGMQTSQSNASIGSASSAPATATGTTTGQAGSASSISAAIPMATSGNMAAAAKAARGGESPSQGRQMASSSATTPTTINVARARVLSDVDADEYEIPVPETFDMSPPRHDAPEMDLDSWAVVDGTGVSRPVMQIRSSRACPDVYDPDSGSLPKQTCPVPACPDPGWRETFPFSLSSEDRYLSVCVWAKLENSRNNLLIGYASIPLHDIAVECAAVNVGRHEQCYVLIPGIHLTANANRAALRAAGAIQPGKLPTSARTWYEREYSGDVRLVFSHLPLPASASASAAPTPSPPRSSAASPCSEPSSPPRPTGRRTSQATSSHTPEKPSKPNSDTSSSTSHSPPPTTAAATAAAATAAAMSSSHANRSGTPSPHGQASSSPITSTAAATSSSATMTSSAAMMTSSLSTMTSSMTSASIAGGDATSLLTRSEGAHVPTSSHGMRARASAMTSSMTSSASPAAAQHTGMLPSNPLPPNTSGNESEHVQRNGNDRSSPCPSPGPGFRDSPQPGDSNVRRKPASVLAQTYTNSPSSRHTPGSRRRSTVSHDFLAITIPVPTSCIICGKKIFKKRCQRCQGCMGAAHTECAISSNTAVCPRTPITEAYSSESDSDYGDDHGGTPAAMTTTSTSSSSATTGPASSSSSSTSSTASARYNSHEHFSSPSSSPTSELRDTDEALVSGSDAVVAAAAATAAAVSAVVAPGDDALSKDAALASFETDKLVRQAGRGMYGDLALEDRRDKLTEQIKRLQQEIDNEKMKQSELLHQRKQATVERHKTVINECISHSNNKLEALTLLMLQYLSGLHDCEEAADS